MMKSMSRSMKQQRVMKPNDLEASNLNLLDSDNDIPGALNFFENPNEVDVKVHSFMMKSMSRSMKQQRVMKPNDLEASNLNLLDSDNEKKDDLNVSIRNYKEKKKELNLIQVDSIVMLTENIDKSYDIEAISESLKQNRIVKKATYKILELFRIQIYFLTQVNGKEQNVLHLACQIGSMELVQMILKKAGPKDLNILKFIMNKKCAIELTPLYYLC